MITDPRANWIKEGAGGTTEEAHQERIFSSVDGSRWSFFYLSLHHTTCIFSLPVRAGPAAHLLGGQTYRDQHLIFHQAPKITQYYVCFKAENITAWVEQGRGEDRAKTLKRFDASLLL